MKLNEIIITIKDRQPIIIDVVSLKKILEDAIKEHYADSTLEINNIHYLSEEEDAPDCSGDLD